jgi:ferrochelatase
MTYGAPSGDADVAAYLARVRGREPSSELVAEMRRRYRIIGGSPLVAITQAQAAALERELGGSFRARAAMRFSEPGIGAQLGALIADGARRVVAVPMSPQWSPVLMAGYERAMTEECPVPFALARSWYREPAFIGAIASAVRESLARLAGAAAAVVLTAHSVPRRVFDAEPGYVADLRESARLIAEASGLGQWTFAYQSAGHTAEEWLRPDLVDVFPSLAAEGATDVLVVPVQFLADHLEVLYDLDVAAAAQARAAGLRYHRIAMPNTRAEFIRALAGIVRALDGAASADEMPGRGPDAKRGEQRGEDGPIERHEERGERRQGEDQDRPPIVLAGDPARRDQHRHPERFRLTDES